MKPTEYVCNAQICADCALIPSARTFHHTVVRAGRACITNFDGLGGGGVKPSGLSAGSDSCRLVALGWGWGGGEGVGVLRVVQY
jgi:hypothetical protein